MAARSLLGTLQQVSGSVEDTETVFRLMDHVASDRGEHPSKIIFSDAIANCFLAI